MRGGLALFLAAVALFAQGTQAARPVRLGPTGVHLSLDDVAQIGRIAAKTGGVPWVVVGHPPPSGDSRRWFVEVFLAPAAVAGGLRRGRIQTVVAALPTMTRYDAPKKWKERASAEFAQLPLPGTDPNAIASNRDLNRPFRVFGALSDESILTIVGLIRSSPVITAPATSRPNQPVAKIFTNVEGAWPISSIALEPNGIKDGRVHVSLLDMKPEERSGQNVVLRPVGKA